MADGESTQYVIPHDLGTEDIIASAYNDATGEKIIPKETANFQDYLLLETTTPIPEGMTVRVVMIGVNSEWTNKPKGSGIVGDIRLLPFRATELPFGWYYPSGDYFDIGSDVGKALNAFSDNYKFDWGIETLDETIRLFDPGKFFTADHGRFFRPVNGISRAPGSTEDDAIRNIKSTSYLDARHANTSPIFDAGPLYYSGATPYGGSVSKLSYDVGYCLWFDASRVVPTADENRPYNVGLTPAVYLGV